MNKKGQLAGAPNQVLSFVVLVIIIAVGGMVLGGIRSADTTEHGPGSVANATNAGLQGVQQYGNFLPTIAIVLVAALLIAIVVGAFMYMRQ